MSKATPNSVSPRLVIIRQQQQQSLDQYLRAASAERQRQEQQRIALELRQQQQRERQHNLKLLLQWHSSAISLGKPVSYVERILEVTADYQRGLPLSEKTIEARQQDARCSPAPDPGATSSGRVEFMKLAQSGF